MILSMYFGVYSTELTTGFSDIDPFERSEECLNKLWLFSRFKWVVWSSALHVIMIVDVVVVIVIIAVVIIIGLIIIIPP